MAQQRLDHASSRLASGLHRNTALHERRLATVGGRFSKGLLDRAVERRSDRLSAVGARLSPPLLSRLNRAEDRLSGLARALNSLNPKTPKPGFARIDDAGGRMVTSAAALTPGQSISLVFPDGARGAQVDGGEPRSGTASNPPSAPRAAKPRPTPPDQGDLF